MEELSTREERNRRIFEVAQRISRAVWEARGPHKEAKLYLEAAWRLMRNEFEVSGLTDEEIERGIREEAERMSKRPREL